MKVKAQISDYSVKWEYEGNKTTCTISKWPDGVSSIQYTGSTIRGVKDTPNKDIARKVSLSRALQAANLPKSVRVYFWETYRTLTKIPRW